MPFFTNIGPNLANKIPSTSSVFNSFFGDEIIETITLKPVTIEELNDISKSFDSGKAPGYDNILMNVIKKSLALISIPLVHVINVSLTTGVFPDKLKAAKVIPVFKAGDPDLFANYRPISLPPNFSKLFERVMYSRLVEFAERLEILYCYQFGFRKKSFYVSCNCSPC